MPLRNREIKSSYTDLFPSLELSYPIENSKLIFNYNRRNERPKYEDLNPIISYQDNYNYRSGNAYLKPTYTDHLQLSYIHNSDWNINVFADHISNLWHYTYFIQNDANGILFTTRKNLKTVNTIGLRFNLPATLTEWWNVNFSSELSYSKFTDTILLSKGTKYIEFHLDQNIILAKTLSANVQSGYESPTFFGITSFRPTYFTNAAISKSLFHKTAALTLAYLDVFNTIRDRAYTHLNNLNINVYDKLASQQIRLSFTYRFGKKTVKAARKHVNGNFEEQKRMGGN
jgi:hypothetical protein